MATSDILGLFTTPEQYQLAQRQAQQAQAIQYANLDPMARANYGTFLAGQQLGGAIGGALGGQDPMLQKISQRQQLIGMIDPSNPDSYVQAIQMALQGGDQEAAFLLRNEMMKAKQQAQGLKRQAQQEQLQDLQITDALTERGLGMQERGLANLANELLGQLQKADGTLNPDVLSRLQSFPQGRAALKALAPETITAKEGETIYQKPTLPNQPFKPLLSGTPKPVPFTGAESNAALDLYQTNDPVKIFNTYGRAGLDAVAQKAKETRLTERPVTNISVQNQMQKGFGENLTDAITSNIKAGSLARPILGAVDSMQILLDEGVKTGFGQETMLQVGKVGQVFNPDFNVKGLAGQEALQSISTNLVLPQVKQLGVNPTDTDLKFINTGSPSLSKTVAGNKLMLSALKLKGQRDQDLARFSNTWLSQNNRLTITNPTQAYVKFNTDFDAYTQSSPLYAPAASQLREQFNALGSTTQRGARTPNAREATDRGGLTKPK
jgi:hypothetical protein